MAVFLGENGILSFGNKTPVTLLQETLQKRGLTPHYELLFNGVGTLNPVFKFQVSAAGFTAIGDGKTKKAAKHDAAASLLKRMQVNRTITENAEVKADPDIEIASPYTGTLNENFVGMLDEVCVINKLPLPVYVPIKEEGPPHARVFTMQCQVSTITETAVARTKKQAKHLAAQQMIGRVQEILGDKFTPLSDTAVDFTEPGENINLPAIENSEIRPDLTVRVADMHNSFFHRTEEFVAPQKFLDLATIETEDFNKILGKATDFLSDLVQELGGFCKTVVTTTTEFRMALQNVDERLFEFLDKEESDSNNSEGEELKDNIDHESSSEKIIYKLQEFDLEPTEEDNSVGRQSFIEKFDISSSQEKVFVHLSVQCPQGSWVFLALGENSELAKHRAAVKALNFLRLMSFPKANAKKL